eukprot:TRINITY_DN3716_c0_g1_i1.p1 TRINITY_DN3716_c0_g1~~TRINITY_DN3716_c0_g1_i1.p1  ORF type:complete len:485 (+),score=125.14 TRINITY_DN3716_c0_g1_i1:101-1555(+)
MRRPPRSTLSSSSAASDVYKRQEYGGANLEPPQRTLHTRTHNMDSADPVHAIERGVFTDGDSQARFGTLPFDQEAVAQHLDSSEHVTYLVVRPGSRSYNLVLDYVAQNLCGAGHSFEVNDLHPAPKAKDQEHAPKHVGLTAGFGMHRFAWAGMELHCLRQTAGDPVGTQCCAEQKEFLVLFAQGAGSEQDLQELCSSLIAASEATQKDSFTIFHWHAQNQFWQRGVTVAARPVHSVILPTETKQRLMSDLDDFLSTDTQDFYTEHGIPYKRSYLFYGEPGSGKTSLIQALAGHYKRNVAYIQPTHPLMTDDSLRAAVQDAPAESVIVFEDIDAMFSRTRENKVDKSPLTFSGLLNALDGIGNPQGQLFVLTTNFKEQLDDALIRNGRVDLQVRFSTACQQQMADMFSAFRPAHSQRAAQFAAGLLVALGHRKISTAALQHYFVLMRRASVEEVIEGVDRVAKLFDERENEKSSEARQQQHQARL